MEIWEVEEVVARIARKNFGIKTLETRHNDSQDFKEVAVWEIRAALKEAYEAGRKAAH